MSQYKELIRRLESLKFVACCDEAAAILRSLDAQRPTVDEVMAQAQVFASAWALVGSRFVSGSGLEEAEQEKKDLRALVEALAAPVAAQPTREQARWQTIHEAQQRYLPLIKAAVDLIAQCHEQLEKSPAPQCYGVPYGHINALREALLHPVEELAAQPQQAKPLSDAEFAIDMLEMMFTAYENGTPCYEDPDDEVGFIGYAVRLADDDFKNIGDFLNRVRPVQTGIKEQG